MSAGNKSWLVCERGCIGMDIQEDPCRTLADRLMQWALRGIHKSGPGEFCEVGISTKYCK